MQMNLLTLSADEFAQREQPRGDSTRRSRLAPFDRDLQSLRTRGFSLDQLRTFLGENGVDVTVAAISAYLRKTQKEQIQPRSV